MKRKRWMQPVGAAVLAVFFLAACGSSGAGSDNGGGGSPDFSNIRVLQIPPGEGTDTLGDPLAAPTPIYYGAMGLVGLVNGVIPLLATWSETNPATYSEGSFTITWQQTGNTWCWTFDDGEVDIQICVTDTGSDFQVEMRYDGLLFLEGTIAYDGSSGTVTVYDIWEGFTEYVYAWEPATSPWDWRIIGSYTFDDGVETSSGSLELFMTSDGSAGSFSGDENGDSFSGGWGV